MLTKFTRCYDASNTSWGHIGFKNWRRLSPSSKKVVELARRQKKSFTVVITRPSVTNVLIHAD